MKVLYYAGNEMICSTKTKDLSGLMAAVEKSESLLFDEEVYYFDHLQLKHCKSEKGHWKEALHIYLNKQEP